MNRMRHAALFLSALLLVGLAAACGDGGSATSSGPTGGSGGTGGTGGSGGSGGTGGMPPAPSGPPGMETVSAGDFWYLPPGHAPIVEEDAEFVELSPPAQYDEVLAVLQRNAANAAAG